MLTTPIYILQHCCMEYVEFMNLLTFYVTQSNESSESMYQ